MKITGSCHCGAVSFVADGSPVYHSLCHCNDCRRWSGAPAAGWMAFKKEQVTVVGKTTSYKSSKNAFREFCSSCGTGLFYRNDSTLPGIIDIQSGTIDDISHYPPTTQIMVKHQLPWMDRIDLIPKFHEYPAG